MIFKTTIIDRCGTEWDVKCEVEGKGMYDDDGRASFMVIEDFRLSDIECSHNGLILKARSTAEMHDLFNEREILFLEKEAEEAFLEDWMNVQDCAHDLTN